MKKTIIWSIIILFLDLVSKIVIVSNLHLYESISVIKNFFNITYVRNTGAAFSILEGSRIIFIILSIIIIVFIYRYLLNNKKKKIEYIMTGLLLGGILGNLVDRIIYGYVIDFLDFNILGYHFPVFNIADSFITISVIYFIFNGFKGD